jgi:hypothetical protein
MDSVGNPGIPTPGELGVVTDDDWVPVTMLFAVTLLVTVAVNELTRSVVEVETVVTAVDVEVTAVAADKAPAGANRRIVERALDENVTKPGEDPTIQPVLGEVM